MINAHNAAFICCRLVAVYSLFLSLATLAHLLAFRIMMPIDQSLGTLFSALGVSALPNAIFFFLFWFGAGWLSKAMTEDLPNEESVSNWSREDVISVAILIIGVALLLSSVGSLVGQILKTLWAVSIKDTINGQETLMHVITDFLQFTLSIMLGIWFLFRSRKIGRKLSQFG